MNEKYNDEKVREILEEKEVPEKLSPESVKKMLDSRAAGVGETEGENMVSGVEHEKNTSPKRGIKWKILKYVSAAAAFVLVAELAGRAIVRISDDDKFSTGENASISNMRYAESYEDVYNYMNLANIGNIAEDMEEVGAVYSDIYFADEEGGFAGEEAAADGGGTYAYNGDMTSENGNSVSKDMGTDTAGEYAGNDFTDTYNQVEGVNEADIVKTDGKTIYYSTGSSVRAAEVENGEFAKVSTIAEDVGFIYEMYLYNDMLVVISDNTPELVYDNDTEARDGYYYGFNTDYTTLITFYSKENLSVIGSYQQDGSFTDIRLMDDGAMYLITTDDNTDLIYNTTAGIKPEETEKYIPSNCVNGEEKTVEYSDILISDLEPAVESDSTSFINLAGFDLSGEKPYQPQDFKAVTGTAGTVYCSQDNIYITYGWEFTDITRFEIGEGRIIPRAGTNVRGVLNDQFSMSEFDGYFRIATTVYTFDPIGISGSDRSNSIYILDMNLNTVGSLEGFGDNEDIRSVNFDGDMAYVVTYRQTDPLFSVDLSNPQQPVMRDDLKITGYSSYMQKWQDGMLLGFGESGDEDGSVTGIKLAMFDNSDPDNLKVLDTVEINDTEDEYVYSCALYERKALLISYERNIIGFPVNTDKIYTDSYNSEFQFVFYSFENGKFRSLGTISESCDPESGYYAGFQRAVIIGDYVYVLSDVKFISADLSSFNETDSFDFPPEYDQPVVYGGYVE
ncbi:MAG: beta-propeller domain-containing protein [Porcipelethomonas sp.]